MWWCILLAVVVLDICNSLSTPLSKPSPAFLVQHLSLLSTSLHNHTGQSLPTFACPPAAVSAELAAAVHADSDLVLLSHGLGTDPIFTYASEAAQRLFGYTFEEFLTTPSRLSAEPSLQSARSDALAQMRAKGVIEEYEAVRVSREGERFRINATVWELYDGDGERLGDAAMFKTSDCTFLL